MTEQERDDYRDRLEKLGWRPGGGETWHPNGSVEVNLRRYPETSGESERSIYGTDRDDAIRKEVERLEAEGTAGE